MILTSDSPRLTSNRRFPLTVVRTLRPHPELFMMPTYPSPETWEHANKRQAQRAARSFDVLRRRAVPVYSGPLFVADDDEGEIQPADEGARRALVLWAVELRAEGVPQDEAIAIIEHLNLWR